MKLEVGKYYKDSENRVLKIISIIEGSRYPALGIPEDDESRAFRFTLEGEFVHSEFNLISECERPLDFDWDCLPKWADKYIAMDSNGFWAAFSLCPNKVFNGWQLTEGVSSYIPDRYSPKFTGNWKESLFKNPKYED